jgi:hypothetical protein
MKILLPFLLSLLLLSCGGGDANNDIEAPPLLEKPKTEATYNNEEATSLFLSAFTLVEGAVEVSQLIESEFVYFAYDKAATNVRPCINNGNVHINFSEDFTVGCCTLQCSAFLVF